MAKKITPEKAAKLLKNPPSGRKLTDSQLQYFNDVVATEPPTLAPLAKSGAWLDKYNDGGPMQENYNDAQASTGPDFVGLGYNTKGRNYSPAWGGQFAMGGSVPGAVGFTYARTQDPAPSNGKYAKKTLASAMHGKEIPKAAFGDYFQESGQASIGKGIGSGIGNMILPGIGGMVGGFIGGIAGNALGGADDANRLKGYQDSTKRNLEETGYAQGAQAIQSQYSSFMQNGGEMQYYQNGLDWKPKSISKDGSVIKDNREQLAQTGITTNTKSGTANPTAQVTTLAKEAERKSKEKTKNKAIVADRKKNIAASVAAKEQPFSAQQLADVTQATGDKLRLFPNDPHSFVDDYLNPGVFIGNLASGMGRVPLDIQQGNYGRAALNAAMPAMIGAGEAIAAPYLKQAGSKAGKYLTEETALKNDAAGNIYDVMNKWWKRENAPETKHKDAINVLNEFKQRIKTPEGQKRLKDLGISNDAFLQKLKIIEDNTTYGYYNSGKIGLHKDIPNISTVTRHEIEHGVQGALANDAMVAAKKGSFDDRMNALTKGPTEIDNILSNLELRKTPNKVVYGPERTEDMHLDPYELNRKMLDKQAATDYFTYGSEGREKSAFAAEAQQYMLDKGIIKHPYESITPDKVKDAMMESMFDKDNPIRLFQIMKNTDNNYKTISSALNKMLTVSPIIAGGAATLAGSKEKKNGGWLNKYK